MQRKVNTINNQLFSSMLNICFGSYSVVLTIGPSRGYGDGGEGSMQLTAAILTASTALMGQLVFAGVTVGSLLGHWAAACKYRMDTTPNIPTQRHQGWELMGLCTLGLILHN